MLGDGLLLLAAGLVATRLHTASAASTSAHVATDADADYVSQALVEYSYHD